MNPFDPTNVSSPLHPLNPANPISPMHPGNARRWDEDATKITEVPKTERPWTCEHTETALVGVGLLAVMMVQAVAWICFVYRGEESGDRL